VIEVKRINADTYHLTINGELWSEVEWSPSRQRWCIQDAAGHCLAHEEHIVGQDRDPQTAIRLAKKMIVTGAMPTPEEAHRQLEEREGRQEEDQDQDHQDKEGEYLGEPWVPLEDRVAVGARKDED
jgi:hypothetical protein